MNIKVLLRLIKRVSKTLNKGNLFDIVLDNTIKQGSLYKQLKTMPKFQSVDFLRYILETPDKLAEALAGLNPQELAKLSEAINKARQEGFTQDQQTGVEAQALSSSWLIYGEYTPIDNKRGTIRITTIQGKSYDFPQPIKYSTWERMKYAQGRNGSGAGQIFWDEYWGKIKGRQPKEGVATLFKLLELRKRKAKANKVVKLSKREAKKKGYKKWL